VLDEETARRYRETWERAFQRGASLPEELDRARMLLTTQRYKELIESLMFELSGEPPQVLAARIGVKLESATFNDGVRAAIAWMDRRPKER